MTMTRDLWNSRKCAWGNPKGKKRRSPVKPRDELARKARNAMATWIRRLKK